MPRTRHSNGQLKPLNHRGTTAARQTARQDRASFRRSLALEHGRTRQIAVASFSLLSRGFFGRMKWLLLGR